MITIFTPTYNRGYCLSQLYNSLLKQTCSKFIWLIVDDGSIDDTKEIVTQWIKEDIIKIQYENQENQGMHGAHNTAFDLIETELCTCIDSDDFMPDNAVELILKAWGVIERKDEVYGIVGNDIFKNGTIVGKELPQNIKYSTLYDLYYKYKTRGDKKLVFKTDLIKKYPRYPIFEGETFVPLGILYLMLDQQYKLYCLNEPLCVVEYLPDGSTQNIFKQYKRHPRGFRYSRLIELKYMKSIKSKILKVLHLISSTLFIGDFAFFRKNPAKVLTFLLLPIGVVFHLYILNKIRK